MFSEIYTTEEICSAGDKIVDVFDIVNIRKGMTRIQFPIKMKRFFINV